MSTTPGGHWQREELAASYSERRRVLVPLLDVQEDLLRELLQRRRPPAERFLDLGCGAGAISELVLDSLPGSSGVGLDLSAPMRSRAAAALARHAGRWRTVAADLNDPAWPSALPGGRYELIVSGLAIHHLPAARKRALFAEALSLLQPGGMFVNMDYVAIEGPLRGLFDERMHANALAAAHRCGGDPERDVDLDDDDDRPDTLEQQLAWLREAGFEQVQAHFKWAEAAIYGGVRPRKGDD